MATVKKSKKKIVIPICILLVLAIAGGSVFGVIRSKKGEEVSLYTIATDDVYENVSLTGDVTSGAVKEYKVGTVATVKEVFVKVGDTVKEGDVLATFDSTAVDGQVASLQSDYNNAAAEYEKAVKEQKLAKKTADSLKKQIDKTQKKIDKLENQPVTVASKANTTEMTTAKAPEKEGRAKGVSKGSSADNASLYDEFPSLQAPTDNNGSSSSIPTDRYVVNASAYPSASYGTVTGGGIYNQADTATLQAVPNNGYTFFGWYNSTSSIINGDEPVSTAQTITIKYIGKSMVTYYAVFVEENGQSSTKPSITTPSVTVPSVTVPSVTTPSVTVPSVTVPSVSIPSVSTPSVSTPSVSTPSITVPTTGQNGNTISDLVEALTQISTSITEITDDVQTMSDITELVGKTIADAIASGQIDSEVIADLVGEAFAEAIRDGIIDAAKLTVESGVAQETIERAVGAIDFEGITRAVTDSQNVSLTAAQIQLAALEAQYEIYSAKADNTIVNAQNTAMKATKTALDALKSQQTELKNGWRAAFDGTITAVDITSDSSTNLMSTGIRLENMDTLVATVSLGEYDVHKVKVGMACKVTTAYGSYDGEVATIAPTATGGNDSSMLDNVGSMVGISGISSLTASGAGVLCTVTIKEPDENIIVGFDANVEIETGEYLGVTVVPIESIVLEKTGSYVYLYDEEENTVTKTQIETGAVCDSCYEVKSGIKVGDKIVATPSSDYKEDTFKVKVVDKTNKK